MTEREAQSAGTRLLGLETGASHTSVMVADGQGRILEAFTLGPANLRLISESELKALLQGIHSRTGTVDAIGAGVAGLRNERDRARFLRVARQVWAHTPIVVSHDLEPAIMSAGPLPDPVKARVLLLSGTGSCAWGRRRDGRSVRFGGRGHILGDQGSACDIALAALRRIVYQHDVMGKFPRLGEAVLRAAQLNEPEDLIPWTLEATKDELGRLAVTIFREERRGDPIAREVVRGAVEKLADMALHCAAHLLPRRGWVQFVFAGGVLLKQPAFAAAVRRRIHAHWQHAKVMSLRGASVKGAVEMAKNGGGHVRRRNGDGTNVFVGFPGRAGIDRLAREVADGTAQSEVGQARHHAAAGRGGPDAPRGCHGAGRDPAREGQSRLAPAQGDRRIQNRRPAFLRGRRHQRPARHPGRERMSADVPGFAGPGAGHHRGRPARHLERG